MRNVILNETKILNDLLNNGIKTESDGKVMSILARHYLSLGMSQEEVFYNVDKVMKEVDEDYDSQLSGEFIYRMIKNFVSIGRVGLVNVSKIVITDTEWQRLMKITDNQEFRIAFILLCYYKVNLIKKPNCNGWLKIDKSTLMQEAKIKVEEDSCRRLHPLYKRGYIDVPLPVPGAKNKDSYRILFADDESNVGKAFIEITNFDDIISYCYEYRDGVRYKECTECGKRYKVKPKDTSSKYCPTCKKKVANKQKNEYKKRQKSKKL